MTKEFILLIILISLLFYVGYGMFTTYGIMMAAIQNPDCPITKCVCPEVVSPSKDTKDNEFSFQKCRYSTMCEFGGYCPAQERSYKSELDVCQRLLENLENYD